MNPSVCMVIPPEDHKWVRTIHGEVVFGHVAGNQVSDIRVKIQKSPYDPNLWAWGIIGTVFYGVEPSLDEAIMTSINHIALFGRRKKDNRSEPPDVCEGPG